VGPLRRNFPSYLHRRQGYHPQRRHPRTLLFPSLCFHLDHRPQRKWQDYSSHRHLHAGLTLPVINSALKRLRLLGLFDLPLIPTLCRRPLHITSGVKIPSLRPLPRLQRYHKHRHRSGKPYTSACANAPFRSLPPRLLHMPAFKQVSGRPVP
jgi:hypothetical protein